MNPERWHRIKELFDGALAVDAPGRESWLDIACSDDAELRGEVASLLVAHARENAVVDKPAAAYVTGAGLRAGADQWLGERLGPYEITALIGHGGMGEVYRARRMDAEYEKEVAIKLVPAGYQAEHVLRRLRTERQILAGLEHPNIARLMDGGASDSGVPYLVLELVDGVPIDRYCEGKPLARQLELFRAVCDAVSYAHQRLIVHRDLKPGNILVTTDGTVKLLDFGIAKLLQGTPGDAPVDANVTLMTTFTPAFASPEQVLGKPITTASDVYSLGVLLYRLLALRSPYRRPLDTTQDAIREVCESEPAPPSSVVAGVPRDLDAICLCALRKEPERRYRSVDELSNDIRRYLAGLPVSARGDRFGYRAGKFLRRHRIEVAAAALVLATLVGGVVNSMHAARLADAERARAERHFQSVRTLADTFMFKVHDAIAPLPGSTEARGLLVDTSLQYLNTLATEAGDDRALQLDLANAYGKVADIQGKISNPNLGKPREALASYAKAGSLAQNLLSGEPANHAARHTLASSQIESSRILLILGETKQALEISRSAVGHFEAISTAKPGDDTALRDLARNYAVHSIALDFAGFDADSRAYIQKAIGLMEGIVARAPEDRDLRRRLAATYATATGSMIQKETNLADLATAIDYMSKALRIDEALAAEPGVVNSDLTRAQMVAHFNLANLFNFSGQYAAAEEHCVRSRELLSRLRADAKNLEPDIDEALMQMHCARSARGLGRFEDARRIGATNVALLTRMSATNDSLTVRYLLGATQELMGGMAARDGSWQKARELYSSALAYLDEVAEKTALDAVDLQIVEDARAGLARAEAALKTRTVPIS
jgi:eukaryotic-like serine/threonine-protein kinase